MASRALMLKRGMIISLKAGGQTGNLTALFTHVHFPAMLQRLTPASHQNGFTGISQQGLCTHGVYRVKK